MPILTTEIHLVERQEHPIYGRIFDGYISGTDEPFTSDLKVKCSMVFMQALAWKSEVLQRAQEWSEHKKKSARMARPLTIVFNQLWFLTISNHLRGENIMIWFLLGCAACISIVFVWGRVDGEQ